MDTMKTAELDERIAKVQQQLDQLRNRDHVPSAHRQHYYQALSEAERELLALIREKETQ